MVYKESDENYLSQKEDWELIEGYVMRYQAQFKEGATKEDTIDGKKAGEEILNKLSPLIKKYKTLLKGGQIDWNDAEMKSFITNFMDDRHLIRALNRKKQSAEFRALIYRKFEFIIQTYGQIDEVEMIIDLQMLLLLKANKYKQIGKNFCSYLFNSYKYEVARHIKKFIKNPLNIPYKHRMYEDYIGETENFNNHEDNYYDDETGIPNINWISGNSCSDIFSKLSSIDRKILIKYYMEEWNDSQISDLLGMHINTVNHRRRTASKLVAENLGLTSLDIKRTRRSGRSVILPTM